MIDDLTPEQRASLDTLRSARKACPPGDALVEYDGMSESERAAHPAHAHIVTCSRCQLVLLHLGEPVAGENAAIASSSTSAIRLRWALPLAAVAVLAVAFTLVNRGQAPPVLAPGNQTDTVRGTELQAIAPAGATELLREFTWQSPIRADRYRVIVRRGATVVWLAETSELRLAPPPTGTIERDVQYEWQVEAVDREGNVRMTSPPQSFVVY